ncbi:hypothetical protein B0A49_07044 [Cryomyces minteri]|uniref:Uncharacterized protein n=1 Tax=Cryomyces minteri TaxID=331657 RepID=A0A4U0X3D0_9PEZI|nr:hypothetical protein B0A49_07044 [Cryomyces minteri]
MASKNEPVPLSEANALPTRDAVAAAASLPVYDATGQSQPFSSLYTPRPSSSSSSSASRHLIIFVRHFFCGVCLPPPLSPLPVYLHPPRPPDTPQHTALTGAQNCQDFIRALSAAITPAALAALPTRTTLTIIGCGASDLIPMYAHATHCAFPLFADPDRAIYDALGMTRTLNLGPRKPDYVVGGMVANVLSSVWQGLKQGAAALKGGDVQQVGGEFLFDGAGEVTWCHRMRYTRDHTEVEELKTMLGLSG